MFMLNIFNSTRFTATVLTGCLLLAAPAFAADATKSSALVEQDITAEAAVPKEAIVEVADPVTEANAINSDKISAFRFEGNELLDSVSIEQHLSNFVGLRKNSTNLFKAKLSVKKIYNKSGLPGVAVSKARVEADGTVVITIIEDKIKTAQPTLTDTVNVESAVSDIIEPATEPTNQAAPDIEAAGQNNTAEMPELKPLPAPAAWLVDGWQQIETGNTAEAMAIWQQKVNKMHGYRYLSFIGVYKSLKTAIRILKQAGLEHHALMLVAERNGKPAYYVLSALKTSYDKEQRQVELTSLRKKMGIDYIYASAARRFQDQPSASTSPASEAVEKPEAIQIKVETETTTPSKPALKKQIVKKASRKAAVKKPISQVPAKEPEAQVVEEVKTSDGKITGFEIYGNSLISDKTIQRQLQSYLGDNKTSSDLLQARNKITRLYQGRGYPVIAVSMPEEVKGEIIPVRIYEVSGTKRALAR